MINSLVKPGMGDSSDWRYGCLSICRTGKASLPVCLLTGYAYVIRVL